jgi:hypothetical protein
MGQNTGVIKISRNNVRPKTERIEMSRNMAKLQKEPKYVAARPKYRRNQTK